MYRKLLILVIVSVAIASCQRPNKALDQKKAELEKLMKEQAEVNEKVTKLRKEIDEMDTVAMSQKKIKSVEVTKAELKEFRHYIDATAVVESDQNTIVTAKQPGFVINNILVKAGDAVNAGQILCTVDNNVLLQNREALKVQYDMASTAYQRQKNLWDKNIGSEIQYLQAKTQKEALEKQLSSLETQITNTNVVAPFAGTIESVGFKVGDNTANTMGGIRVVNNSRLKITAKLPDTYISKVHKGNQVKINIPDLGNKEIEAAISFVGNTISNSRTFEVQIMLDHNSDLKPNMNANLRINDAVFPKVFVLEENMIHSSEGQKSIYIIERTDKKIFARKIVVTTEESYGGKVVVTGIKEGDEVITTGYMGINDGEEVKL